MKRSVTKFHPFISKCSTIYSERPNSPYKHP